MAGVIVLGIGIWLVADKSSFISLLKSVEVDHVQVSQREVTRNEFLEITLLLEKSSPVGHEIQI